MKRILCFFLVAIIMVSFVPAGRQMAVPIPASNDLLADTAVWKVDRNNSSLMFSVTHLVVSKSEGVFKTFEGNMKSSKADFSDARISFAIDVSSIDTDSEGRDKHLKGPDYFDAPKYPQILFESISFKPAGGKKYTLTGIMTLKGISRTVVFDVVSTAGSAQAGNVSFICKTTIDRYEFNMRAGSPAVGKDVTITVNVELSKI